MKLKQITKALTGQVKPSYADIRRAVDELNKAGRVQAENHGGDIEHTDPILELFSGIRFRNSRDKAVVERRIRDYVPRTFQRLFESERNRRQTERRAHRIQVRFLTEALELEQARHRSDITAFSEREPKEIGDTVESERD